MIQCEDCRFWIPDGCKVLPHRNPNVPLLNPDYAISQGRCTQEALLALIPVEKWPVRTAAHDGCTEFEAIGSDGYVEVELVSQAYDEEKETIRVVRLRRDETITLQGNESIRSVRSDDG